MSLLSVYLFALIFLILTPWIINLHISLRKEKIINNHFKKNQFKMLQKINEIQKTITSHEQNRTKTEH